MLDAPVGRRRPGHPAHALRRRNLETVVAFLNHLGHFMRSLDLLAGVGHGRGHFEGIVVSECFLDGFEVDFQARSRIAVHGQRVEDERVAFVRSAERDDQRLGFAEIERLFPRLERQSKLVLGHHVLQRFGTAFVVPHFHEQSVDHDASGKGAVPGGLALEQIVVGFAEGHDGGGVEMLAPASLFRIVQIPQRLGRGQLQRVKLIETDGRRVVVRQREHTEEDVDGVVGSSTAFIHNPLFPRRRPLSCLGPDLELVSITGDHLPSELEV